MLSVTAAGKTSLPSSSSARQTEGQRAAAQRLREWQERRRRSAAGDREDTHVERRQVGSRRRGEVVVGRAVRNYNVKEDGDLGFAFSQS